MAEPRGPAALVTDARRPPRHRPQLSLRAGTGSISVDGILQYASDIPSAQKRTPPGAQRPAMQARTPSGRHPLDPKLTGRLAPQHIPSRTSKLSEKLVILPETEQTDDERDKLARRNDAPPKDQELQDSAGLLRGKTYAESLPKAYRTTKIPRVTAYGTAQAYKMRPTAEFLRTSHGAKTKLYDDCLYAVYHLPLVPGIDGYRIRSSPLLKSPGGKSILDEEIERNERRERHDDGYFEPEDRYGVGASPERERRRSRTSISPERRPSSPPGLNPALMSVAEMFLFSYGVVVFWNFTERQEKDCLADLAFATNESGASLLTRPQPETDFETEEFHFEYNPLVPRPRIFNDMYVSWPPICSH
jgi:uncharacterized Rmd1/YagE family protein